MAAIYGHFEILVFFSRLWGATKIKTILNEQGQNGNELIFMLMRHVTSDHVLRPYGVKQAIVTRELSGRSAEDTLLHMGNLKWLIKQYSDLDFGVPRGIFKMALCDDDGSEQLSPLNFAAALGSFELVEYLLIHNASIDYYPRGGASSLSYAVRNRHNKLIEYLLECGADIDTGQGFQFPIFAAVADNYCEGLRFLLKNKADLYVGFGENYSILQYAIEQVIEYGGNISLVEILLQENCDPNDYPVFSPTPLYVAVKAGHEAIVRLLIAAKANPNVYDEESELTPLGIAVSQSDETMCRLLLASGASATAVFSEGYTLLTLAAECNKTVNIMTLLLAALTPEETLGLINQAVPGCGTTALHLASKYNDLDMAELLIAHGANRHAVNSEGLLPRDMVQHKGNAKLLQLLHVPKRKNKKPSAPSQVSQTFFSSSDGVITSSSSLAMSLNIGDNSTF